MTVDHRSVEELRTALERAELERDVKAREAELSRQKDHLRPFVSVLIALLVLTPLVALSAIAATGVLLPLEVWRLAAPTAALAVAAAAVVFYLRIRMRLARLTALELALARQRLKANDLLTSIRQDSAAHAAE